mgnify:CR=1 FL=1
MQAHMRRPTIYHTQHCELNVHNVAGRDARQALLDIVSAGVLLEPYLTWLPSQSLSDERGMKKCRGTPQTPSNSLWSNIYDDNGMILLQTF